MFKSMIKGIVFDIQKFSINDGPGIRTTVFLKGCTLNCAWCHNPESKSLLSQLAYKQDKCIYCGSCQKVCPNHVHTVSEDGKHVLNIEACQVCGKCVEVCPSSALFIYGKLMTVVDVMSEVLKDRLYFETSNGGMTLSGGEPLAQEAFALALVIAAKDANISVVVETALAVRPNILRNIAQYVEWFLVDYKITDSLDFGKYVQGNQELILRNLALLDELEANVVLRCPIIPNINDIDKHFEAISRIASTFKSIDHIEILPYHRMGETKANEIGALYTINEKIPEEMIVDQWIAKIQSCGYTKVIRG